MGVKNVRTVGINNEVTDTNVGVAGVGERELMSLTQGSVGFDSGGSDIFFDGNNEFTCLVIDINSISRFIYSVAKARALQDNLKTIFKTSVYAVEIPIIDFKWKPIAGSSEVEFEDQKTISKMTFTYYDQYLKVALSKADSPKNFAKYLRELERLRTICFNNIESQINDARLINKKIQDSHALVLKTISLIKFAADTIIITLPLSMGKNPPPVVLAIGLGYSLITTTLAEAAEGKSVNAVIFKDSEVVARQIGGEVSGKMAETIELIAKTEKEANKAIKAIAKQEQLIAQHRRIVRNTTRSLKKHPSNLSKVRQANKARAAIATAGHEINLLKAAIDTGKGGAGRTMLKSLPKGGFVFLSKAFVLWDLYDATNSFISNWENASDRRF